jgi:hypothetical protein
MLWCPSLRSPSPKANVVRVRSNLSPLSLQAAPVIGWQVELAVVLELRYNPVARLVVRTGAPACARRASLQRWAGLSKTLQRARSLKRDGCVGVPNWWCPRTGVTEPMIGGRFGEARTRLGGRPGVPSDLPKR